MGRDCQDPLSQQMMTHAARRHVGVVSSRLSLSSQDSYPRVMPQLVGDLSPSSVFKDAHLLFLRPTHVSGQCRSVSCLAKTKQSLDRCRKPENSTAEKQSAEVTTPAYF